MFSEKRELEWLETKNDVVPVKSPEEKREAVALTINLCIQKGYLAKYFEEHRAEVEKIMLTMLSLKYVRMASERTQRIKIDRSSVCTGFDYKKER